MSIDHSTTSVTLPSRLVDVLGGLQHDAVILPGLDTWDSPVYPSESVFLSKFMRIEKIDCGYLHATGERQFEEKFSAELEAVANVVLAVLNSDILPAVVRCLTTIIRRLRVPALRVQFIYRKSAEGDEFTCLRAEGNADSVIQALREIADRAYREQDEK